MITTVRHSRSSRPRRLLGTVSAAGVALLMALAGPAAVAQSAPRTYDNPVSQSFADTFADPSIIHARDGYWYAYSTADPLKAGGEPGIMNIARTKDFVTWDYQGTVFNDNNRPSWATADSGLWAPDIRYVDGQYLMYYTVTDTTLNASDDDSAIGVATAPTPVGPWTPGDKPVVAPRADGNNFFWTIDPAGFTDLDGQRYLYFGSYYGGIWATRMSADGKTATGALTQVAIDNRYEGGYVVRHGSWYYLMASSANCCAGPTTGYSVFSGRSKSPLGPFKDADGISLLASKVGGTIMLTQNGNRWIGAGHHAIATDNAGRDYVVYHAIDKAVPWLDEPFGVNRRPMLIDRLDWIDGWPRTRAGAGPSDTPQTAPVTGSSLGINAANPAAAGFRRLRQGPVDPQAGKTGRVRGTVRTEDSLSGGAVRIRLDVRGDEPLRLALGRGAKRVAVTVDPLRDRLVLKTGTGGTSRRDVAPLGLGEGSWRTLTLEIGNGQVLAQLSESDLNDPLAEVSLPMVGTTVGRTPVRLHSADAVVDNVSVRPLAQEATKPAATPKTGPLLLADEFNGPLSKDWNWVREDGAATVSGGALNWPLEAADLTGQSNNAGVLLRDTPDGQWIAQTKLTLDLGEDEVRNYQQAGLVAYVNDDDFARLSSVAIWNTRQTEYGRELVANADGDTSYGGALVGTPAATVWLRLAHTRNAAGEQLYRAATSRDGKTWTWGAVWTFPASARPRIGLVAHGGNTPAVTAKFSYLRFYGIR